MKKIISIILAVCMVFSMTVTAAPVPASTVETAQETVAEQSNASDGELLNVANTSVRPGLNILTGTAEPLTGENAGNYDLPTIFNIQPGTTLSVGTSPDNASDYVLKWHIPTGGTQTTYPTLGVNLNSSLESIVGHNMVFIKYRARKDAALTENDTYYNATNHWIMVNSGSGDDVVLSAPLNAVNTGWKTTYNLLNMLKYNKTDKDTASTYVTFIRFQNEVVSIPRTSANIPADSVDTYIYYDDFSIVPAYRFNFYTPDGKTLLDTKYEAVDENQKVITSYTPATGLYGNYYVSGWTTSIGGAKVDTYTLNNENVDFYALDYTPAVTINADGELAAKNDTMTLVPTVISALKDTLSVSKGKWTIEDESVASIATNKNGSATVTALTEGETKATFTVGNVSATYDISVVFPYEVDVTGLADIITIYDIAPDDYTAMVVTTEGTGEAALLVSVDGANDLIELELNGNTDGSVKDTYVDLTAYEEDWAGGAGTQVRMMSDSDIITGIKLYKHFEPSLKLEIKCDSALLAVPGEEVKVSATVESNLRGIYSEDYTLTIADESDVASEKIYNDGTALIRAKVATGIVTVTATSADDESISVSKDIYVNVDSNKYGHYHEFLGKTALDSSEIAPCLDVSGNGNTAVTLGTDVLNLDRPTTDSGTGGVTVKGTSPASQKYLVVKTKETSSKLKLYYHYDSSGTSEANTASSTGVSNDDGTRTYVFNMANVPSDAKNIGSLIIQIGAETSVDVICIYTTSEEPVSAAKDAIGYTWDFSTKTFKAGSGHHFLSSYDTTAGTVTVTMAYADIGDGVVNVKGTATTLADGTPIYKLEKDSGGSIEPNQKPSGLILNDYPYMWIKYKANGTANVNLYLADTDSASLKDGNTSGTQWDNKAISIPASEDYTTLVVNLQELGYKAALNTAFSGMMFAYRGQTVLDNVLYDEEGKFYYIVSPATYKNSVSVTIDEISFANYDPTSEEEKTIPLNMAITLTADKNAITSDGGSVTITPTVYANQTISTDAVTWKVESGSVKITENDDGTITVTATDNGDAKITATAVEDSSFSASITIAVSGQRAKIASYDFKYYALGNSYLSHGVFNNGNGWPWPDAEKGNRGMAASSYEKDYYHRVQYYLTTGFKSTISAVRGNYAGLERACNYDATANPITTAAQAIEAIKNNSDYKTIRSYIIDNQPNIITVQLSENFSGPYNDEVTRAFYDTVYGMIDEVRPEKSVVVVMTPFATGTRPTIIKEYAAKYGFYVADMTDVPSYSTVNSANRYFEKDDVIYDRGNDSWKYNPYLAWEQYPEYDTYRQEQFDKTDSWPTEFRTHPGDKGMDLIGQRMFEQFQKAVPSYLDAEYVYIPTAISINGDSEITQSGASVTLTAVSAEEDASNEVVWSIDNERIAEIDENGVVTAKVNGTVTVTATSAFDSDIKATHIITITGQPEVYTLSYKAGTTDTVSGLPAADAYASGEYILSSSVPERNGYKFLGWAETENGTVVDTVTVNEDKNVYAVWALAEGWHFDKDSDTEGISFGGFNVTVADGIGTVLPYDDGVSISDSTLILKGSEFDSFNFKMSITGTEEASVSVAVTIITDERTFTYEKTGATVGEQLVYSFDISEITGTITGFSIKPNLAICTANVDWIEFERCALSEDVEVDKVNAVNSYTVDADGNTFKIDTLTVNSGVVVTLKNGTFVIGEIVGDGAVATNGNLVYTGELDGYVTADLGEKTNADNLRYAEVDGIQYEIDGNKFGLILAEGDTKLVQIVEKAEDDDVVTAATKYYVLSADGAEEITVLANAIDNVDEVTLRVKDPVGVRFKAGILNTAKTDAVVKEYGFVIALERDLLNADAELTLDFKKVATGSAYISGTDTDVVYGTDGATTFFAGVLYGIPENSYGVNLVSKTFTKIEVDGKEYVVYGEPVTANAYRIAKTYENDEALSDEAKAIVNNIIDKAENGNELGFDFGDI